MPPLSYPNRQAMLRIPQVGQYLVEALDSIAKQAGEGLQQAGVGPNGAVSDPPPQISGFSVVASGGTAVFTIQDNNPITRNIEYWVEYSESPDFKTFFPISLGASRSGTLHLAGKLLYFRAYSQYNPTSAPSPHLNFGNPTLVAMGSSGNAPTLPTPTGSGTEPAMQPRGGAGAGFQPTRGTVVSK